MASENPGNNPDDFDMRNNFNGKFKIPMVDFNREISAGNQEQEGVEPPYMVSQDEDIQLETKSIEGTNGNYIASLPPDEGPEGDYSLRSYFKGLTCFIAVENVFVLLKQKIKVSNLFKRIFLSLLLLLYIGYFIAALILPSNVRENNYWCDGDGFLIVITSIVFACLFYFKIFKPYIGRKLYKSLTVQLKKSTTFKKLEEISELWYVKMIIYSIAIAIFIIFLIIDSENDRSRLASLFGIFVLIFLGFVFSVAPRKVIWRQVLWGLGLQFVMGLIILRWSIGRATFGCLGAKLNSFLSFSDKGSQFVFGKLSSELFIFAFKILTVIFFFSFCVQVLYFYGAMQWIVMKLGWLLQVTIGTTACESVNAAANIFLGMFEAPLLIKPFLNSMTKSELHAVMTGGFATIAGAVLAAYISFGVDSAHLLSASVMSAPAALGFSKLVYPENEISKTNAKDIKIVKGTQSNIIHAACEGVTTAIPLIVNIAVNLIAFVAFIAFVDAVMNWTCLLVNLEDGVCSLSNIFGYVFMPLAWIMGVPWKDCYYVGQLIGTKTIINEFVGYLKLADYIKNKIITKRSEIIATYALCGFSNIAGIGVNIAAFGSLVPERKRDFADIAFRAMIAGSCACLLTACVAGCLINADEAYVNTSGVINNNSTQLI